jgi:CelD/BcsL family acetyltransferase involved in cellulose biosynthesis
MGQTVSPPFLSRAASGAARPLPATPSEQVQGKNWWREPGLSVAATHDIEDVKDQWLRLEAQGLESPGQSFDFIKAWIKRFEIPASACLFITGSLRGKVVALMALRRHKYLGANILCWFPGEHVGCNAPLIDHKGFATLGSEEKRELWRQMRRAMIGADLVLLDKVPQLEGDHFANLGKSVAAETLYRSEYESWEMCDRTQRNRSRRKHDKQQGAKLSALGKVGFEELTAADNYSDALSTLFRQKSFRFADWGIKDPFADEKVRQFYDDIFRGDGSLGGKLHVLSLDGEIVAVRYNLVHGKRNFALISSMSERGELRPGSPGKQNILRAMQAIFEAGFEICDMGEGYSDEKRHWCNVKIPLRTHYIALGKKGELIASLHRLKQRLRKAIKGNERAFSFFKRLRSGGGH